MDISNNNPTRVAVIGASGYGGIQAIRLLKEHPDFEISFLGGHKSIGKRWNDLCPFLSLEQDLFIKETNSVDIANSCDVALLSLPNGVSSQLTPLLLDLNIRVIDLSADFRFRSLEQWKDIYSTVADNFSRSDEILCKKAIYGIPELYAKQISTANLVASPGCFPTASLLPLMPFVKQGLIEDEGIIIDAKSGTSGGGRNPKEHLMLAEASESISPYGVIGHRHTSEIEQELNLLSGNNIQVQFTPHLIPMVRGILCTTYARLRDPGLTAEDCRTILQTTFREHSSVEILPVGIYPKTKWVRYTNRVMISVQVDKRNSRIILMSAIDNLIKGQAGQALQNLNLMIGNESNKGLPLNTFYP